MLRLTDKELTSLLDGIESDRAERKAAYRSDVPKKSRQAVCAFANNNIWSWHQVFHSVIPRASRGIQQLRD